MELIKYSELQDRIKQPTITLSDCYETLKREMGFYITDSPVKFDIWIDGRCDQISLAMYPEDYDNIQYINIEYKGSCLGGYQIYINSKQQESIKTTQDLLYFCLRWAYNIVERELERR